MKKKVFLSAAITIALCLSIIAGATFALFTSDYKVNAAINAGNVDISAYVKDNPILTSSLGANVAETAVTVTGNTITLNQFIPGDSVSFDIVVHNESDITVKCKTIISVLNDTGLWDGLVVTIGGAVFSPTASSVESNWDVVTPNSQDVIIPVTITLPESAGNEYKTTVCTLVYNVYAVQGNYDPAPATTDTDPAETTDLVEPSAPVETTAPVETESETERQ